jgi:hypothetical protein
MLRFAAMSDTTEANKMMVDDFRAGTRYVNTLTSGLLQAAVGMAVPDVIEHDSLRNTPLMYIGQGANEIQRVIISKQLVARSPT